MKSSFPIDVKFLSRCIWVLVWTVSIGYAAFMSTFAEWHISFSFLPFPIFVGEILLAICLTLCLFGFFLGHFSFKSWMWLVVVYFLWILLCALWGYAEYGVLAFRNAAMFYYGLFAFCLFLTFEHIGFKNKQLLMVFVGLGLFIVLGFFRTAYFFPIFLMMLCFSWHIKGVFYKFILIALSILIYFLTSDFAHQGRAMLLAQIIGFLYIIFTMILMRVNRVYLVILILLGVVSTIILVDTNSPNFKRFMTIARFEKIHQSFLKEDRVVQSRKESYQYKRVEPKLFNDNITIRLQHENDEYLRSLKRLKRFSLNDINDYKISDEVIMKTPIGNEESINDTKNKILSELINEIKSINYDSLNDQQKSLINDKILKKYFENPKYILEHPKYIEEKLNIKKGEKSLGEALDLVNLHHEVMTFRLQQEDLNSAFSNILFRLFIWRDMFEELKESHFYKGVGFGKPQRSISIEILKMAQDEWMRDGWITPHNFFLHLVYRAGFMGIIVVFFIFGSIAWLTRCFLKYRSLIGVLLTGVLVYYVIYASFSVVLEFPYHAILFWSIFGVCFGYAHSLKKDLKLH